MTTYTFATDFTYDDSSKKLDVDNISVDSLSVGTASAASSAIAEFSSTSKGTLFPRMTTAQMNAIASPTNGLLIYNTTEGKFYGYQSGAWAELGSGGGGGGGTNYYNYSVVASVEVDFNSTSAQTIFTVPAGKALMVQDAFIRSLGDTPVYTNYANSPSIGTTIASVFTPIGGFYNLTLDNGAINNTLRWSPVLVSNNPATVATNLRSYNGDHWNVEIGAGDVLQFKCGELPTSGATTGIIDIVGYLYVPDQVYNPVDTVGITRLATATLDMTNTSTAQNIYTVPTGKKLVTTEIVMREFTDSYSTVIDIKYDSEAWFMRFSGTVFAEGTVGYSFNNIGSATNLATLSRRNKVGTAGQALNTLLTVAGTGTAVVDVFGYLVDA